MLLCLPVLSSINKMLGGCYSTVMIIISFSFFFFSQDVFYSHQKFKKPDLQFQPHHSFSDEVLSIDIH